MIGMEVTPDYQISGALKDTNVSDNWHIVYTASRRHFLVCLPPLAPSFFNCTCLASLGKEMMSVDLSRGAWPVIDGYLRNIASPSTSDLWRSFSSLSQGFQNMAGRLQSQKQAISQATALSAPVNRLADITGPEPACSKSKRVYVQRDRNRMKCTRCIMHQRGCDGGPPQYENCRISEKACEWVEVGITR